MDKRTFFKTPDGGIYSVSERLTDYVPAEGVVEASKEEVDALENQEIKFSVQEIDELLQNNFISKDLHQQLLDKIEEKEQEKITKESAKISYEADVKRLKEEKQAAIKATKEARIEANKQAAIEAQKEAEKQAKIEKRQ
jgi:hypothetical protein